MRGRTIAGAVLLGLVAGIGSAVVVIASGGGVGDSREVRGWRYNPLVGSAAAGPYTRAMVAKSGLLALTKAETIYFVLQRDTAGKRLSARCRYRLSGGALPARWWSVTIYAADDFLPVNGDQAESADATRVAKGAGGRWSVEVSATRPATGDWISSKNAGTFDLQLRLYNPSATARDTPQSIPMPTIETLGCAA